jgi:hypothetical protein
MIRTGIGIGLLLGIVALAAVGAGAASGASADAGVTANNSFSTAQPITDGTYDGQNVPADESAFYAIELNDSEQVTLSTEGASENLELTLYAPDQATVLRTADESFESDVDFTQVAAQDGIYYLELDSTNDRTTGYTLRVSSNQSIDLPNLAPTASAGGNQSVDPGETVTLDASGSTDRNGDDLAYNWT